MSDTQGIISITELKDYITEKELATKLECSRQQLGNYRRKGKISEDNYTTLKIKETNNIVNSNICYKKEFVNSHYQELFDTFHKVKKTEKVEKTETVEVKKTEEVKEEIKFEPIVSKKEEKIETAREPKGFFAKIKAFFGGLYYD